MSGAFFAFFLILMFVSRVEFARSSVFLLGLVLAIIIGLASRRKYSPFYKYLNTGLLGLILTLLMNVLGEQNAGVPTAMVMSLIVVAMYYRKRREPECHIAANLLIGPGYEWSSRSRTPAKAGNLKYHGRCSALLPRFPRSG